MKVLKTANISLNYALVSVYDKTDIIDLVKSLVNNNFQIISTGGTAKVLKKAKIKVIPIEKITDNPEAFDGRMKTISFQVESGILYDRKNKDHLRQAKELKIPDIQIVVCNFYPFQEIARDKKAQIEKLVELIDVGGPTMVRAAAKNYKSVAVLTDPSDYPLVIPEFKKRKNVSLKTREYLAVKAFKLTADYDSLVHEKLSAKLLGEKNLRLFLNNGLKLRYGENPHQKGFFYQTATDDPLAISNFKQLQGKELSFNNLLDCHAAINTICEVATQKPACIIIKHGNPCGTAIADSSYNAFLKAWDSDSLAAFGSIIVLNKVIDKKLAQLMIKGNRFFEVLLAPSLTPEAKKILAQKRNLRILTNPSLQNLFLSKEKDYKKVRGGFLVQDADTAVLEKKDLKTVTRAKPTKKKIKELLFAWSVCRSCKSNSIVITKGQQLIGAGVGQQDRMRCCRLSASKAGKKAENASAASDAFFPFPDGPEILIKAGVRAIIQPGGSVNDQKIIDLCDKNKVVMVFTNTRCFKH